MGLKSRLQKELQYFFLAGRATPCRRWDILHLGVVILVFLMPTACLRQLKQEIPDAGELAVETLRQRLSVPAVVALGGNGFAIAGRGYPASPWLRSFYLERGFRLAWSSANGPLARTTELIQVLANAPADGLAHGDFRLDQIEATVGRCQSLEERVRGLEGESPGPGDGPAGPQRNSDLLDCLVDLDLLLTDGFLRFASALHRGKVLPSQVHSFWQVKEPKVNLSSLLRTAIDLNRIALTLEGMRPTLGGYTRLRAALQEYQAIADSGGWRPSRVVKTRPEGGYSSLEIRERLHLTGDLDSDALGGSPAEELACALGRFQLRHGLLASGQIDQETHKALEVPLEDRIEQLRLNLERWRWLPHRQGSRYVLVRIADYELDVVEDGAVVMNMRVIVGKPFWRTPIFSSQMTHLVINPHWYIPTSIAAADILPRARRDSTYLRTREILLFTGVGDSIREVSSADVDWKRVSADDLAYRFTQLPGAKNPLGRVKFHFDNPYDVFLHDTPRGELFVEERREFSHGCIRLEKSLELAAFALADRPGWTTVELLEEVVSGSTQSVQLTSPLPVYVMSWTAWVDADETVHFRGDPYGDDDRLRGLMAESRSL